MRRRARTRIRRLLLALGLLAGAGGGLWAQSAPPTTVRMGMVAALSGPAAPLGQQMRLGIEAAFLAASDQRLRYVLEVRDDGYEPDRTVPHVREFVADEGITALVGNVGTPTAVVTLPMIGRARLPLIAPFTGAGALRKGAQAREVFNFRASYEEEVAFALDALCRDTSLAPRDIAFLTQRDAFGDSGYAGGVLALRRHGLENPRLLCHTRYERNTVAVEAALAHLLARDHPPRVVVLVGTSAPCARFIRLARRYGLPSLMIAVSFVGAQALADELGKDAEGVVVSQVVPHPLADLPGLDRYRRELAAHAPQARPSHVSLEGWLGAQMALAAARRAPVPDRAGLRRSLRSLGDLDFGIGPGLRLDAEDRQASHRVWLTVIRDGEVQPIEVEAFRRLLPEAEAPR